MVFVQQLSSTINLFSDIGKEPPALVLYPDFHKHDSQPPEDQPEKKQAKQSSLLTRQSSRKHSTFTTSAVSESSGKQQRQSRPVQEKQHLGRPPIRTQRGNYQPYGSYKTQPTSTRSSSQNQYLSPLSTRQDDKSSSQKRSTRLMTFYSMTRNPPGAYQGHHQQRDDQQGTAAGQKDKYNDDKFGYGLYN